MNSQGLCIDGEYGRESLTRLFTDKEKALDEAYGNYVCCFDEYGTECVENDVLDEETFKYEMIEYRHVYMQYPNFHIQFEIFEQDI